MKLKRLLLIGTLLLTGILGILFISVSDTEAAFGTSPPWVRNDHMLPGTSFEQIVNFSRNDASKDMQIEVELSGEENLVDWIEIVDKDNLIMKKGQTVLPMKVRIEVPRRAAIKNYTGDIYAVLNPLREVRGQGGTLDIKVGAHILVDIDVTGTKVTDYNIKTANFTVLNEDDFFKFNLLIENLGNTEIDMLDGTVEIFNRSEQEPIETLPLSKLVSPVGPDQLVNSRIEYKNLKLSAGEYWVNIKVNRESETIFNKRFLQKVVPTPIEEPEVKKSGPAIPDMSEKTEPVDIPEVVNTSAPVIVQSSTDQIFIWFGIAGFAFALLISIIVIIFLIRFTKNQQKTIEMIAGREKEINPKPVIQKEFNPSNQYEVKPQSNNQIQP